MNPQSESLVPDGHTLVVRSKHARVIVSWHFKRGHYHLIVPELGKDIRYYSWCDCVATYALLCDMLHETALNEDGTYYE